MADNPKQTRVMPKAKPGDKRLTGQYWKGRSKHGRDKIFSSPQMLWEAACEYFEWVEDTPLETIKTVHHQGDLVELPCTKRRPMTIVALCVFLNIRRRSWLNYRENESHSEFAAVVEKIEDIIWCQKFEGAAVEIFNANIIARQLGLKEGHEFSGPNNTGLLPSIDTSALSTSALKELMAAKNEAE